MNMKSIQYKCKLLSDLVISSKAATEGFHQSLDYIPGAKFLGLAAKELYDENQPQQTMDLFHNGTVRFGDAHPYVEGERLLKAPASWLEPKGVGRSIFLAHYLPRAEKNRMERVNIQYFSSAREISHTVGQNFAIKSAYDMDTRRSKDEQMYGYFAIQKGTEWSFIIDYEDDKYKKLVDQALLGKRRIGRSRSAQYGLIEISKIGEVTLPSRPIGAGEAYLYAESNLCFYDKYGKCTTSPAAEQLLLPPGSEIIWEKSQIRSRYYQTWNQHRRSRDADRLIIRKGSVIAVSLSQTIDSSRFAEGVGAHLSEGFGRISVNPSFLMSDTAELALSFPEQETSLGKEKVYLVERGENDEQILTFLKHRAEIRETDFNLNKLVNSFIQGTSTEYKYEEIPNSQWGQVRKYAKGSADSRILRTFLFDEQFGFFHRGQSESLWRSRGRRKHLEKFLFESGDVPEYAIIDFLTKLSAEMAKVSRDK